MKIYESEKSLASLIENSKTSSSVLPIKLTEEKPDSLINSLAQIEKDGCDSKLGKALAQLSNEQHPDLMYGSAILASTVMNRNDDVFLPSETWAARNTSINTPFNDEHIETDIIGHIIAARPLDAEGKVIADQEESPEYFDIEVDFVVYKGIFPAIAKEILEKAPDGQKFVSMEAKFANFDYAIIDQGKTNAKIVSRNENTAFLTKYLRAYGGTGYYEGQKIGRVLRNFRFVGMGSVDTPANPSSEYTRLDDINFTSQVEKVESTIKVVLHVTKGNVMKIETLEQANELIANLTSELEQLKVQADKNETEALKAQLQKANDELSAANSKVEIANQQLVTEQTKYTELNTSLEGVKTELAIKSEKLNAINAEAKASERVAKLKDLGVEVTDEKRAKIVALSDEAFASVVEFTESLKPSMKKEDETATDASAVAEAEKQAKAALESAEKSNTAAVETTPGDDEVETQKFQKTAAKLVEAVRKTRTSKK